MLPESGVYQAVGKVVPARSLGRHMVLSDLEVGSGSGWISRSDGNSNGTNHAEAQLLLLILLLLLLPLLLLLLLLPLLIAMAMGVWRTPPGGPGSDKNGGPWTSDFPEAPKSSCPQVGPEGSTIHPLRRSLQCYHEIDEMYFLCSHQWCRRMSPEGLL